MSLLALWLVMPDAAGVRAQQALPPLADTMYDTPILRDGQLAGPGSGSYVAGDVYSFDIILEEEAGAEIVWRKVLRTKPVSVK